MSSQNIKTEKRQLAQIIDTVVAYLEVEQELGQEAFHINWRQTSAFQPSFHKNKPRNETVKTLSSLEQKNNALKRLASEAAQCSECVLHKSRTHSVFSRGTAAAKLVFVGEGPGQEEDRQGVPFVGNAGQLLDRMIAAMKFQRDEVYICNVVKCRPPRNRTPYSEEAEACERFLKSQLEIVAPEVIVALGKCAAINLGVASETGSWRGKWKKWNNIPVMPTYHPAFLLRNPEHKRDVWQDLQAVMKLLKIPN